MVISSKLRYRKSNFVEQIFGRSLVLQDASSSSAKYDQKSVWRLATLAFLIFKVKAKGRL